MTKLVRDLMHPGLLTCRPNATLGQVAVLLNQNHVHALIVEDRDGRPLGIISDVDLLTGEWLSVDDHSLATMRKLTAADLMSKPVDSVEANLSLTEAVRELMEKDVSRLLVTDKGKPVGVISLSGLGRLVLVRQPAAPHGPGRSVALGHAGPVLCGRRHLLG